MRQLEIPTLELAAESYAAMWGRPDRKTRSGKMFADGPSRVLQDLNLAHFDDEHDFLLNSDAGIKAYLGRKPLANFEMLVKDRIAPRDGKAHVKNLRERLAIDPLGNHIPGCRGTVQIGSRIVGGSSKIIKTRKFGEIRVPKTLYWPVYAGEPEERLLGNSKVVDPLPEGAEPWPVEILYALNTNISAEAAIAALDAITARLDEGSTAATIRGRTGSQPADPDASETGTLLFTLTMSDPAFGAAGDDTPGALATADTITDDASADATNTLTYCRMGATGTGADDHIDGSAGTSDANFIFNTVAIVSGAVVEMTSCTLFLSQGPTAT